MEIGDYVKFINNEGIVDDSVCELIEIKKDHYRIKKNSGEIIRIFHDRVFNAENNNHYKENTKMTTDEFDPLENLPDGIEVWVKSNNFNESVICNTYALIDPNASEYKSVNTYNGKARKTMSYAMKDYNSLINRLQKRGYKKE